MKPKRKKTEWFNVLFMDFRSNIVALGNKKQPEVWTKLDKIDIQLSAKFKED